MSERQSDLRALYLAVLRGKQPYVFVEIKTDLVICHRCVHSSKNVAFKTVRWDNNDYLCGWCHKEVIPR